MGAQLKDRKQGQQSTNKTAQVGSLQAYARHMCTCEDVSPKLFPLEDVQNIAFLDLRLFNTDRHLGNILFRPCTANNSNGNNVRYRDRFFSRSFDENKKQNLIDDNIETGIDVQRVKSISFDSTATFTKKRENRCLTPIDHGFCLPRIFSLDEVLFEWINWPQVKEPIHDSLLSYIENPNNENDLNTVQNVLGDLI